MNQHTIVPGSKDVVGYLKSQHEQIKGLFEQVIAAQGKEREKTFFELRKLMAAHETAEEEIVHPKAKAVLADGPAEVAARLKEENEAKTVLVALEKLDVSSAEFETKIRKLQSAVLMHAQSEEQEEFDELAAKLDGKELQSMRKAAEAAEAVAPTRAHPGVESQIANLAAGPIAAIADRARDAISRKG